MTEVQSQVESKSPSSSSSSSNLPDYKVESVMEKLINRMNNQNIPVDTRLLQQQMQEAIDAETIFNTYFKPLLLEEKTSEEFVMGLAKSFLYYKEQSFEDDGIVDVEDHIQSLLFQFETYKQDISQYGLPCKLFLNALREEPSSLLHRIGAGVLTKYGLVHAGIQIGPYIIDWNTTALVSPRPLRTHRTVLAVLDLHHNVAMNRQELIEICQFIARWNADMKYGNLNSSRTRALKSLKGNCHAFTKDFMRSFGIVQYWKKGGIIDTYLNNVRKTDVSVKPTFNKVTFECHEDLDAFYRKYYGEKGRPDDDEVYELLRSFDAAFWIRGIPTTQCPIVNALQTKSNESDLSSNLFQVTRSATLDSDTDSDCSSEEDIDSDDVDDLLS